MRRKSKQWKKICEKIIKSKHRLNSQNKESYNSKILKHKNANIK